MDSSKFSEEQNPTVSAMVTRPEFDPNSALGSEARLIRESAGGDLAAQRKMRDPYLNAISTVDVATPSAILFGVEMVSYARLCAAHGDRADARSLAAALYWTYAASQSAGFGERAAGLAGEAVAILERLANEGDEIASLSAIQMVNLVPAAGDIARRLISEGH